MEKMILFSVLAYKLTAILHLYHLKFNFLLKVNNCVQKCILSEKNNPSLKKIVKSRIFSQLN